MILSGKEIERHMGNEIIIKPFNKSQLNPNSYNLRLADELMIYDLHELDRKRIPGILLRFRKRVIFLNLINCI